MTTAHRPTWYNAIGGENQGGNRKVSQTAKVCSRDLPGHTKMKTRDLSEYTEDKEKIKMNLMQLEGGANGGGIGGGSGDYGGGSSDRLRAIENVKKLANHDFTNPFPEDEDDDIGDNWKTKKKKRKRKKERNWEREKRGKVKMDTIKEKMHESDEESGDNGKYQNDDESEDSSEESESDESDEEEKELMRELENLKRERLEKQKREKEEQEVLKKKKNNVLTNNPLINLEDSSDGEDAEENRKKRKWTDEAIFRNTYEKTEKKSAFINDTVRTAFHKKFLFKYIH
ncbi:pre-mRNA-splicing factor CWC15, putative [Plasmodium ovale]|uniref:Cell cycle control protein cwf15, putative n=3 Tax=Plasmodium ovale TaxID=36330 RepID=A0A1A8VM98_PLAOA|nr:cell cycle control protein cwf15, putative [Plasmodium ovale curtisi]SCA48477.1 pre-mRNA-splicing factor CWC15, putative [Plasmodium ovale]